MGIDLDKNLAWTRAGTDERALLADLQGNILKGHGRDHTHNLFLHFDVSDATRPAAQAFVAELASELTTAIAQLEGAAAYRDGTDAGLFMAFFLTARHEAGSLAGKTVPNNFNYEKADPPGLRCPFAGHIRKTNPRGESEKKFGLANGSEIRRLIARRGITYGIRAVDPNTPDLRFEDMPTGDVGLLFMAYQSDLVEQFEFTQKSWANNPGFLNDDTGIDPVIGQAPTSTGQRWPSKWSETLAADRFDFGGFVTMLGGDYFFAPSISSLRAIAS